MTHVRLSPFVPAALTSATYDAANELTQWGASTLSYDTNGNLANDGASTYSWDARNQLSSMSGSVNASFGYDAFGRRIGRNSTSFLYDGQNSVQEMAGGSPIANILTGGIDENFLRSDISGTWNFLSDHLGSTSALADSTGTIQTQYTYEPFGSTTLTGLADSNAAQYTGREDDGTGLYYYRARYYQPLEGRFISQDPIGFAGGLNRYAYAGANPVSFIDPIGTDKGLNWLQCLAVDIISAHVSCTWSNGPIIENYPNEPHLYGAYGGLNPPRSPVSNTRYVVTENGKVIPIPPGYEGRVADNGRGLVYQAPGATGGARSIRIMDANPQNPYGYVRIYNSYGQPIDPGTGLPGTSADTHIPLNYSGEIIPE